MEESEEAVVVNSGRLKSVVWNDFDRVKKGETYIAICRHCKRILSGSSTSGTSHLRNHLIRCRRRSNHDVTQLLTKGKRKQSPLALTSYSPLLIKNEAYTASHSDSEPVPKVRNTGLRRFDFDFRQSQLDLARMIIMHGYPLNMVEDVGFKTFVNKLQPLFDLVSVDRVEADCLEIYRKEKQRVYEEFDKLPGKFSLSVDSWAAGDTMYLCLKGHYIDESWELKKKVLNFLAITAPQADEFLSEVVMSSLRNWDIEQKLFSLTIDNHSTYDRIVSRMKDHLCQHKFLMCEGQLFDIRCAASTVKLLVQHVLGTSTDLIDKVRETIRFLKKSRENQEKFDEIVQLLGINYQKAVTLDHPLQWSSTYLMLEASLEYKEAFSQLEEQTCIDWNRLRDITNILKFFHEVSKVFVENNHLTSNSYFAEICDIHLQLIEWCQKSDDFISTLALELKSKFDEYWKKCSLIMAISAILDPRFKMKLVEYYYPQIYGDSAVDCIGIVSNCMKALYNGHALYTPLTSIGECSNSDTSFSVNKDRLTGFDQFLHESSLNHHTNSDLDKYLEEPLFPRSADFSILNWWKVHEPRYPVLSMMARNILGIPISKVTMESHFNQCWSSLKPDILQAMICSQDWMRCELEEQYSSHIVN